MAVWCVGFAVVNIVLENTDYLADSEYTDHAAALTVMNWLVVGLKLLGAAVALLSVAKRPPLLPPRLLGVMVWSVFATLAVYVLGGMAQALGMVLGLIGDASQVDRAARAHARVVTWTRAWPTRGGQHGLRDSDCFAGGH